MVKKMLAIGAVVLVGVVVVGVVLAWALPREVDAAGNGRGAAWEGRDAVELTDGAEIGSTRPYPAIDGYETGDLSESEVQALQMALEDEYKAWSVYEQVIADFGAVRPFTNIQRAEEKHIDALVTLLERYGLAVPENKWPGAVPTFDSLTEACAAAAQAEIENAALYDQLFSLVDNPDIMQAFMALQQASQTKHLPAFEACAH